MYSLELVKIWSSDSTIEKISEESGDYNLIKEFLLNTSKELPEIFKSLSNYDNSEDKDNLINKLYRFSHYSAGFSNLFSLKKLNHLFKILEFIFDSSRKLNTIHLHSFDYLSKLILETIIIITKELLEKNHSNVNITLLIDESLVYLQKPIEVYIEKKELAQKNKIEIKEKFIDEKVEIESKKIPSKVEFKESIPFEQNLQDDEPEELNIPAEKITLISDFYEESYELLTKIENNLVILEENPKDLETLNDIFRSLHTIKGGTRILKVSKMEKLSHSLEDLLDKLRKSELDVNERIIDLLLFGKKLLSEMLDEVASKGPVRTRINSFLKKVHSLYNNNEINSGKKIPEIEFQKNEKIKEVIPKNSEAKVSEPIIRIKEKQVESIRVNIDKLDDVINTSSELSITRLQFQEQISLLSKNIRDIKRALAHSKEFEPDFLLSRIQRANENSVQELISYMESVKNKIQREDLENILKPLYNELKSEFGREELTLSEELTLQLIAFQDLKNIMMKNVENLEGFTSRLQNGVMNFRMVPISSLLERFPGLIRDTARQANKKVKLEIKGGETELDRVMINSLADPLIHILRNSIDHGIETEQERIEAGKSDTGSIKISAYYIGSYAVIEISDDGKGIDTEKILQKAIEKNIVTLEKSKSLSEKEILEFIFAPGFSTASEVTELSGRGVGMDVVFSSISQMQGTIDLKTILGKGTNIYLKIPLTLAVVRVLIFESTNQSLALPMGSVEEILTIQRDELQIIGNKILFHLRNEIINLCFISKILENSDSEFLYNEVSIIILSDGDSRIGLIVDKIHGRQEIVIKNLGSLIKKAPFVMGCTILSDRRLVLVLNPKEILDSNEHEKENKPFQLTTNNGKDDISILIVDDSQLQRRNIKSTLNRMGYFVDEAENGFDALKMVRVKKYSLLCVDLVMPLMDGFDLVSRLRSIPLYKTIPIIVITSKNSREDRERGIKVGANEFLEKPVNPEELLKLVNEYTKGETKNV